MAWLRSRVNAHGPGAACAGETVWSAPAPLSCVTFSPCVLELSQPLWGSSSPQRWLADLFLNH